MNPREEIMVPVASDVRRDAVAAVLWAQVRVLAQDVVKTSPRMLDLIARPRRARAHGHLAGLRGLVLALGRLERLELGDETIALPFARGELRGRIDWLLSLSERAPNAATQLDQLLAELGRWRDELD